MSEEIFDYVIVGAGSAGCVLANRLTADGAASVLVLEYGGSDRSIFVQMPSALAIPMNMERYNWYHRTESEPGLGGRSRLCQRQSLCAPNGAAHAGREAPRRRAALRLDPPGDVARRR